MNKKWKYASENNYFDGDKPKAEKNMPHMKQINIIREFISDFKGKKVLEIGVGVGQDSKWFFEQGAHVYALDISQLFINNLIKITNNKVSYKLGDARNIGKLFKNQKFDLIFARWSLTPLTYEEFEVFLINIFNLLPEEGKFYCAVTHGFEDNLYIKHPTGRLSLKLNSKTLTKILPKNLTIIFSKAIKYKTKGLVKNGRQFEFILEKNEFPKEPTALQE